MATSRAYRLPEADEPLSHPSRPTAARRTVTIRGQVPPPPVAAGQIAPVREGVHEGRRPLPVLVPAGESSRDHRPHVDAALARLAQPRRGATRVPARRAASAPAPGGATVAPGRSVTLAYQRRPPRPLARRLAASPDRLAMWAVVMGVCLVLVAALSAHG